MFLPKFCCELNPIEMVWGFIVGVFVTPCALEWSGNPGFDGYKCVAYDYATCLLYIYFKSLHYEITMITEITYIYEISSVNLFIPSHISPLP
jgi:hypothetical protein